MTRVTDLHQRWSDDPAYQKAHQDQAEEFALASVLIAARTRAGLSQADVAARMGTTQSAVARMEGGGTVPSVRSLLKYAEATGSRLTVALDPR
ncbi:antitoxin HigA [mine drainage metagenome]|uniref:Antitoxin HigA n=1 Tax=mine drainage metagenome TaxID=410659 RepID=A0A1J5SYF3_9ZZZZ